MNATHDNSLFRKTQKKQYAFTLWSNTGHDQEVCEHCLRIGTYKLLLDDYIFPTYFVYSRATRYYGIETHQKCYNTYRTIFEEWSITDNNEELLDLAVEGM